MLEAADGHRVLTDCWSPSGTETVRAVVQVLHGLGEHAARYERFAVECVANGYAVVAHNHRGHGETCDGDSLGHFADESGWDKVIADAKLVQDDVLTRFPGVPLVLMGHSMGSYIAQSFVMRHAENVDALILSASTWSPRLKAWLGHMVAGLLAWRQGARAKSAFLDRMSFGDFNRRFAPNRTDFDWLSRDEAEVDSYIADPLCGAPSSNRLWQDVTGGLLEITSRKALRKIPGSLPVLITGGELDPVGGAGRLGRLADQYRVSGHGDVTLKVYPGGRHEMLNETNRDEVSADLLAWIGERI